MDKLFVKLAGSGIGELAVTKEGRYVFEYDREFLDTGFSISPFYLPLREGLFTAKADPFDGLFGVFNDSLPDGWGRLLTGRELRRQGFDISSLNYIDRLALVGDNAVGALSYEPVRELYNESRLTKLEDIADEVRKVLANGDSENLSDLYQRGGSSGGARPKVFWKYHGENWIVKFSAAVDPDNIGEIEYEYSRVAAKCGIIMPETKLFEGKYFGVKRFDFLDGKRLHVHSASGLLHASYRYPSLDYSELIKACLALTKKMTEALKLFRQMVFNVLCKNKDDHSKNFSFICEEGEWFLSPAYDLVYSHGIRGEHTTSVLGVGNPDRKNLFDCGLQCGLPKTSIENIYGEVWENTRELRKEIQKFDF